MSLTYHELYEQWQGPRSQQLRQMAKYAALVDAGAAGEVLDIGCGWGVLLEALQQRGLSCLGIDIDARQVAVAQGAGCRAEHVQDTAAWLRTELAAGRRWRAVFLLDVLEHLDGPAQVELLGLLAQALLPQGQLIVKVPNPDSLVGLRMSQIDFTHRFTPTSDALAHAMRACGLQQVTVRDELPWTEPLPEFWRTHARSPKVLLVDLFYRIATPGFRAWRRAQIAAEIGWPAARHLPLAPNYLCIGRR